jgi:hypothetical protein
MRMSRIHSFARATNPQPLTEETKMARTPKINLMEERWLSMMSAKDESGRRRYEYDLNFQKECHALRVQIEELKASESRAPVLSDVQIAQLNWLDRVQGAKDANGKRIAADISQKGQIFARNIDQARQRIYQGGTLSTEQINNTLAQCVAQGYEVAEYTPPREMTQHELKIAGAQPTAAVVPHHYVPLPQRTKPNGALT